MAPFSTDGIIFPSIASGVHGPTGAGGASPLDNWKSVLIPNGCGAYTITLTGATAPVPEPTSLLLLDSGLVSLMTWRRKQST